MGPAEAITTCFRKSFQFSGRASRVEFWWFAAACAILPWAATRADFLLWPSASWMMSAQFADDHTRATFGMVLSPLSTSASAILLLPLISAAWRRMQDAGAKGAVCLLPLAGLMFGLIVLAIGVLLLPDAGATMPLLIAALAVASGTLLTLLWLCAASQPGPNRYGPNPLEVTP